MSQTGSNRLFASTQSEYGRVFERHQQEHDIVDVIDPSLFDTTNMTNVFRVRNIVNDDVFPFNAEAFVRWFEVNPTHPLTRERLDYIRARVEFKKLCMERLPPKQFQDLTPEFSQSLIPLFMHLINLRSKQRIPMTPEEEVQLLECQAYMDVASWEDSGRMFKDLDYDGTTALLRFKPYGSWLVRKSSKHANVMKNSDIIVLAYIGPSGVRQVRYLHVHGVGWFGGGLDMPLTSLRDLQSRGYVNPEYVTLGHLIESYCMGQWIDIDNLVIPQVPVSEDLSSPPAPIRSVTLDESYKDEPPIDISEPIN